jgi:hypothetical protein
VKIGFEFGHGIEVVEGGIQWSAFMTPVVDQGLLKRIDFLEVLTINF